MSNKMNQNADEAVKTETKEKKHGGKKLKYGALSTTFIIIFVAIVVLVNVIVSVLSNRYSLKMDLTSESYYDISQSTVDYISKLTDDVEVLVLSDEESLSNSGVAYKMLVEMLHKYHAENSKISVEFTDYTKNPTAASKYTEFYKGTLNSNNVVVYSNNRVKVFSFMDMFVLDQEKYQYYQYGYYSFDDCVTGYDTESTLTSAIMYVTNSNPIKLAVLGTQEETQFAEALVSLLNKNGYDNEYVDPVTGSISEDTNLLVIAAPQNDYSEGVIKKLDDFMYNNGAFEKDIIYLASPYQNDTPNIDAFLSTWGIEVDEGYVYQTDDSNQYFDQNNYIQYIYGNLTEEKYSAGITDKKLPIYVPYLSPIKTLFELKNSYTVTTLLSTSDGCVIVPADADENFDVDSLPKASYPVVTVTERSQIVDNKPYSSNVMVIGAVHMTLLDTASLNNNDFLISAINVMTGKSSDDSNLNITAKTPSDYSVTISELQAKVLRIVLFIALPLVVLLIGGIVWFRRKNK